VKKAQENELELRSVSDFQNITGEGIEGIVESTPVKVVSPGYLRKKHIELPDDIQQHKGTTTVFVLVDEELVGYVSLADEIRSESNSAIQILQKMGIEVVMMTGDNESVARSVSEELGMDGYFAEVLPHEKQEKIEKLQQEGEFVAMTGDGVNDAPALAQADVGIAVGSGTDVAAETADIILVESNPKDVSALIAFGKATYRKMIQNLIWATAYNVVAIPLAAGVLYNWDIMISPAVGAVLMSLSTVIVAVNAQLLKGSLNHRRS
jgi:Cu2+-exporting ATPase